MGSAVIEFIVSEKRINYEQIGVGKAWRGGKRYDHDFPLRFGVYLKTCGK